ncbi:ABC transporter permease [uncultured Williamsia sp.]|uniref:ABC transporter permease n=1 Tax=uncultured Williamsia sp. TaxID=259311 RepID=UPI002621CED4|nr:ABC transporter permease [uncultured Williamsia sp.]
MSVTVFHEYRAFVRKEVAERRTYRTAVLLGVVSSLVALGQFAFLGVFLRDGGTLPGMQEYGGSVAAFLISGTAFSGFVMVSLHGLTQSIQAEQVAGTLEAVAGSAVGLLRVMMFGAVTAMIGTFAGSALMLVFFSAVLGFPLSVDPLSLGFALTATVVCLGGFGMAGCGIVLVTKKGDPVSWLVFTTMTLLSGILYPTSVLPGWLQEVAHLLPTTVALDLVRRSLLAGATLSGTAGGSTVLLAWTAVSVPVGAAVLVWGLRATRLRGSLAQF